MNELQTDRFDRLLRKLADIKGGGVAPSFSPEIVPTLPVLEASDVELDYLRDVRLWWHKVYVAAGGAGQYSRHVLINNSTDKLVIVESLCVDVSSNLEVGAMIVGGLYGVPSARDDRYLGQPCGGGIYVGTDAAVMTSHMWAITLIRLPLRVVLKPGGTLGAASIVANVALNSYWEWRERPFTRAELP